MKNANYFQAGILVLLSGITTHETMYLKAL